MASIAEAPSRAERRARGRKAERRPVFGGVAWILAVGLMLAGVVAVNVLVIRLNVDYDELGTQRAGLQADVARLRSQLSSAAAAARIERVAQEHLGLVEADPETTTYLQLPAPGE